jgi:hypothetical protein
VKWNGLIGWIEFWWGTIRRVVCSPARIETEWTFHDVQIDTFLGITTRRLLTSENWVGLKIEYRFTIRVGPLFDVKPGRGCFDPFPSNHPDESNVSSVSKGRVSSLFISLEQPPLPSEIRLVGRRFERDTGGNLFPAAENLNLRGWKWDEFDPTVLEKVLR